MLNKKRICTHGRIRTDTVMFLRHTSPAVGLHGQQATRLTQISYSISTIADSGDIQETRQFIRSGGSLSGTRTRITSVSERRANHSTKRPF